MFLIYRGGSLFNPYFPSYAAGESEIAMGKVIKKLKWKRNDLVISTKVFSAP